MLTKKDFIVLADYISGFNKYAVGARFTTNQITVLANFCEQQNPNFNRERWISYIKGECGPSGGTIKKDKNEHLYETRPQEVVERGI